ncbi:MAG: hypothetical protein ACYDEN_10405 [Acidimicrobiales bacterium]
MTERAVVGVLGAEVAPRAAAALGYGLRELSVYRMACIHALLDNGLLPFGITSVHAGGAQISDFVSGLVALDEGAHPADAGGTSSAIPVVIDALTGGLPVLAIGSGEALLAAAVEWLPGLFPGPTGAAASTPGRRTAAPPVAPRPDLAAELGVQAGSSPVVARRPVPAGLYPVVIGADGSVCALAPAGGTPALAVRWDPGRLSAEDQARDGPFRWLRRQISAGCGARNAASVGAAQGEQG